ncbi:hypothetical protein V6N12_058308 [Hibiscus sabdariffa]|uniref:DUF4283 domain-containing protein n=1 Tax=Hibiscus sabdariffa TaxID=183260 RepID=A0ABR2ES83_9ROSI
MKNPSHSPDENLRNKKPRQHDEEPPDDWPSDMEVNISVPAANLIVIDPTSPRNVEEGNDKTHPFQNLLPSYKDTLIGKPIALSPDDEEILDEKDIEILEDDVTLSTTNGVISIDFSTRVHDLAVKSLRDTVVIKLLGRRIGYNTLRTHLYELWKPSQPFRLMDIENDYFLVTLRSQVDYMKIISGGSWIIFSHYLIVEPWTTKFYTSQPHPNRVVAWIRLPGLPVLLYKKSFITEICKCVGPVIKLTIKLKVDVADVSLT